MNRRIRRGCVTVCAFAVLTMVAGAPAKTLTVGDSSKADFPDIRTAVGAAESGDIIIIEEGLYYGPANQDIKIIGKSLILRSRDPANARVVADTIIDCQGGGYSTHYALAAGPDGSTRLTLEGLTIRKGYDAYAGGALRCEQADLEVTNCTFEDNVIDWWGGAVYCTNNYARFTGCTFLNNTSVALHGGAIFCRSSRLELVNCSFKGNTGGAIENYDSQISLTGCTFEENTNENGGAIHSRKDMSVEEPTRLTLTRCTFTGNSATGSGGALYNYRIEATLEACTFTSNSAGQDAGAVYNYGSSPTITNCAFLSNLADDLGGAMLNLYGSSPRIINCTVAANRAGLGGAIAGKGRSDPLISHSILWKNTAIQGKSLALVRNDWDAIRTASATVEYSDLEGGRKDVYLESGCELDWSFKNLEADPLFAGATRGDFNLLAESPCIDAGDPAYKPDPNAVDLNGNPRLSGVAVDLGAYETGGNPVYRFWSPITGRHFYTIKQGERDKLLKDYAHAWTYEGIAFYASSRRLDPDMVPVHRLWSARQSSHFWSIDEKEVQKLRDSPDAWVYEGVAFYAYPPFKQPWGTVPVHRFWWTKRGGHFYTADEKEKNKLLDQWKDVWTYEGIVWYVLAGPRQ